MTSRPFSNGTEEQVWMSAWCDGCEKDHDMHAHGQGPGCEIVMLYMVDPMEDRPEWVDVSDIRGHTLPKAMSCMSFAACRYCDPDSEDPPAPIVPCPGQTTIEDFLPVAVHA